MPKMSILPSGDLSDFKLVNFLYTLKGVAIAYIVTLMLIFMLALGITYTSLPESFIPAGVVLITILSNLVSGTMVARRANSSGWLNGSIVGLIYMLILYLCGCISHIGREYSPNIFAMFAIGFLAGAAGGIVGINLGKKPPKKVRRK